jgi:hypothetical protein
LTAGRRELARLAATRLIGRSKALAMEAWAGYCCRSARERRALGRAARRMMALCLGRGFDGWRAGGQRARRLRVVRLRAVAR